MRVVELCALRSRMARRSHDRVVRRFLLAFEPSVREGTAAHPELSIEERSINGQTALVLRRRGVEVGVLGFEVRWGRVRRLWIVPNLKNLP